MARRVPAASPATVIPLPKVSFQKIEDDVSTQPGGVHDHQARSYGYNDFSDFRRPDHYIRYIEPLESELAVQVEYDMDEQDQEWLDAVNVERKKEQLNTVSYEAFEIIMDRLEKEWFDLTKNIPKPDLALPSEDSTCAICDDSEGENSNAIVFCDGCNLAVHQDCYGVPYIPEGQWLCRKCTVSPENPVSCILCPNEGGAFKQTILGEWVHLLCAIWVPETRVANDVFMEPITGIDKISKQRWKLKCSICDIREGACIQCAKTSCFLAFHATCARRERLLLPMKSAHGSEPATLVCYCERHLPNEQQRARAAALAAEESHLSDVNTNNSAKLSKSARAYAKTYKPGPPLVPAIIVERIMHYVGKVSIRKKSDFVLMMCRYWSLKREARRGAPLLKRLHLEPWTANAGSKVQSEEEKAMKLEQLRRLLRDLESVRSLTELTRKRETRKLRQAETIQDILSRSLFPHEPPLRLVFERIMGLDRQDFFKNPVSKNDVPDYFDIVKNPMCWVMIDRKLDKHEYWDIQAFKDDIHLVLDNAVLYNKSGTPFYKAAVRIRTSAKPILDDLDRLSSPAAVKSGVCNGDGENQGHNEKPSQPSPPIGDLEPPLILLKLLVNADFIKDDIDLVLNDDPLTSLFNYECGQLKPLPSPSPPPPPKVPKPKRGRRPNIVRQRQTEGITAPADVGTEAGLQEVLDSSPGFRTPRTRRAAAAAAAFEAEAHGTAKVPEAGSSSTTSGNAKQGKRWKRGPATLPGRSEVPPMVDDVDNQKSFKMFDAGWILPPDQRRGGRAPVERQAVPPPRKKIRLDPGASRLSVISTAASENQTLRTTPLVGVPENSAAKPTAVAEAGGDDVMNVDTQAPAYTVATKRAPVRVRLTQPDVPLSGNMIKAPNGTIIIEELDTPALRREKSARRKAEKLRLAAEAEKQLVAGPSRTSGSKSSLSRPPVTSENEMDWDLSSLSEIGSDEADAETSFMSKSATAQSSSSQRQPQVSLPKPELGAIVLAEGEMLEGGTLVWAKADTYPWWPAVVYEADDFRVPGNIDKMVRKKGKGAHLVQFFDDNMSWALLGVDKLKLLGEDRGFDAEFLAPTSRKQRWKNAQVRHNCVEAYKKAVSEMETTADTGEDGVQIEGVSEADS